MTKIQTEGFRQIISRLLHKLNYLPLRHRSFWVIVRCRLGELNNLRLTLLLFQRRKIYR